MAETRGERLLLLVGPAHFLVVGAGKVGRRKARTLLEAECDVRLVDPLPPDELATHPRIEYRRREFHESDLDGMLAVFACTDRPELNATICAAAESRGMLYNDASAGGRSNVRLPAVHRSAHLSVAVATRDGTPTLARLTRELICAALPLDALDAYGALLTEIRARIPSVDRPRIMSRLADPDVFERFRLEGPGILDEYIPARDDEGKDSTGSPITAR